jgi:hypothetical protein
MAVKADKKDGETDTRHSSDLIEVINKSKQKLHLVKGIINPGETGTATYAELGALHIYLEKCDG